jgi:DNA-binding CsgD family transcriptional regulator
MPQDREDMLSAGDVGRVRVVKAHRCCALAVRLSCCESPPLLCACRALVVLFSRRSYAACMAIDLVGAFAGRATELQIGLQALEASAAVVLVANPGLGRSRTASELAHRRQPDAIVRVPGVEGLRSVAFGAFAHIPAPTEAPNVTPAAHDMLARVASCLPERAPGSTRRPLLLADDAHLLDRESAALIRSMFEAGRIDLVLTCPANESLPVDLLAMWRNGSCWRIDLDPLSPADVAAMVAAIVGGPVALVTQGRLWAASLGSPMFLRELVHEGLSTQHLELRDGEWKWEGPMGRGRRLRDVVGEQLARLSTDEQHALEVLALSGPVPFPVAASLIDSTVLDGLIRRGFASTERETHGLPRPAHELVDIAGGCIRTVVSERIGPANRRVLSGQLHDALAPWEAKTSVHAELCRLRRASLAVEAGVADGPALLAAAIAALRIHDISRAESLVREALALPLVPSGAPHFLTEVLASKGDHAGAHRQLSSIAQADLDDAEARHAWALRMAENSFLNGSDRSDAVAFLAQHGTPEGHVGEQEAVRCWIELFDGEVALAGKTAFAVLDDPASSSTAIVWAGVAGAVGGAIAGDAARADLDLRAASARIASDDHGLAFGGMQLGLATVMVDIMTCQWKRAVTDAETGLDNALRAGDPPEVLGAWAGFAGLAHKESGRLDRAVAYLNESITNIGTIDPYHCRGLIRSELAACLGVLGDRKAASEQMRAIDTERAATGLFTALMLRNHAWVHGAAGDRSACARALADAATHAARTGQTMIELLVRVDMARLLGRPLGDEHRARLSSNDHPGSILLADLADGLTKVTPALGTLAVARRLDAAGSALLASEAALAASLRDAACTPHALDLLHDHQRTWRTPIRDEHRNRSGQLSPRQREIVRLARLQLSSADIAAALGISVRTVDNQLGAIYRKIGITSRRELAE